MKFESFLTLHREQWNWNWKERHEKYLRMIMLLSREKDVKFAVTPLAIVSETLKQQN